MLFEKVSLPSEVQIGGYSTLWLVYGSVPSRLAAGSSKIVSPHDAQGEGAVKSFLPRRKIARCAFLHKKKSLGLIVGGGSIYQPKPPAAFQCSSTLLRTWNRDWLLSMSLLNVQFSDELGRHGQKCCCSTSTDVEEAAEDDSSTFLDAG